MVARLRLSLFVFALALSPAVARAGLITYTYVGVAENTTKGGILPATFSITLDSDQPNGLSLTTQNQYESGLHLPDGSIGWYRDTMTMAIGDDWLWSGSLYQEVNLDLVASHALCGSIFWRGFLYPMNPETPQIGTVPESALWTTGSNPAGCGENTGLQDMEPPTAFTFHTGFWTTTEYWRISGSPLQELQRETATVPEPGSLLLFGTGLLALWRQRKGRS